MVVLELARAYLRRYLALHARRRRDGTSAYGVAPEEVAIALGTDDEDEDAGDTEDERIVDLEADIESVPALARLASALGLGSLDLKIVAFLLAPELDAGIERAYTFALDDFTKKRPDLGFVARAIAGPDPDIVASVLHRLSEQTPLRRHGIVVLGTGDMPAIARTVRLADRIVEFCRGSDAIDELARDYVSLSTRTPDVAEVVMGPDVIASIARAFDTTLSSPRIALVGPDGAGRVFIVEALAEGARPVMRIDLAAMVADGRVAERLPAALREVALRDGIGVIEGGTALGNEAPRAIVQTIAELSRTLTVPLVFTVSQRCGWLADVVPTLVEIDVPAPTLVQRIALWSHELPTASEEDIEIVAARYGFTGGTIARVAHRARNAAKLRDPDSGHVTLEDLGDAARLVFSTRLGGLAQRIPVGFTWDDLVLPRDTLEGVREVVRFALHRPFLLEEWGFASKLPYGRGVSAIMAGPPGTGKTMVAQLLARELGYDLYRIDLSQVVNKYIGETEKNLARIFDEAEASHAVLFFDEADALFAKRTDVKSSNDRYANLEVNYLLQRMETFDGVTLLATNVEQGLDPAVKRRVRFLIQFELPDVDERERLWKSMFPPQAPLAAGIDWRTLGKKFEMAGGYIKKAAVRAALRAVDTRRPITLDDLIEAATYEYREMGRIV